MSKEHYRRIIDVDKLVKRTRKKPNIELAIVESAERHGVIVMPPLPNPVEMVREADEFMEEELEKIGRTKKEIRELREKREKKKRREKMIKAGKEIENAIKLSRRQKWPKTSQEKKTSRKRRRLPLFTDAEKAVGPIDRNFTELPCCQERNETLDTTPSNPLVMERETDKFLEKALKALR